MALGRKGSVYCGTFTQPMPMPVLPKHIQDHTLHTWHWAEDKLRAVWRFGLAQLPSACALCEAWPKGPICDACAASECAPAKRCPHCALALTDLATRVQGACADCQQTPPIWHACHASVSYSPAWSGLMHRFKNGDVGLSRLFAGQMLAQAHVARAINDADLLIPVPSHACSNGVTTRHSFCPNN
jgi:hypothetical protein